MSQIHEYKISVEELDRDDLNTEEMDDLLAATKARDLAYSPYSNFSVGAIIRTFNNQVVQGWNVENIVYKGTCAERNALTQLSPKSRETGLKRITVVGGLIGEENDQPISPCGSCRQDLFEYFEPKHKTEVIMAGTHGKVLKVLLKDLLPLGFSPASLKK